MRKLLKFLFWTALVFGVIAGLARATVLRWLQIPNVDPLATTALAPTLQGGDWVLVWRATEPGLGDLVVCPNPQDPDELVVGRIMGEAGDEIAVDSVDVVRNGRKVPTERNCNHEVFVEHPSTGGEVELACDWEEIAGRTHMRARRRADTKFGRPKHIRTTVPEGFVYLVSDNRQFHYDSRNYGSVERDTCREKVFFRLVGPDGFSDPESRLTYIH